MIARREQLLKQVDSGTFTWFLHQAAGPDFDQVTKIEYGNGMLYYNKEGVLIAQHIDGKYCIRVKL